MIFLVLIQAIHFVTETPPESKVSLSVLKRVQSSLPRHVGLFIFSFPCSP